MKTPQIPAMPGMSPLGIAAKHCTYPDCIVPEPEGGICGRPCPTGNRPMIPLNRLSADQKTVAERKWQQRKLAPVAQKPCDHGLFSDDANQLDLIDKLKGE